ncbi:helix-turn-helix domain-containing protein [Kitasatospora sp. NPDC089797]|uniref:helix-turn-helix domain-containing protein n=1 Tax=Kitasatospora sp. NPDC089797 TaxID=3155298 RepID=UPI0034425DFB
MSFDAITWALEHSPVSDPFERLILTCLARRANADGCDSYPSRNTLAKASLCDKSTVTRKLAGLEKRGIIREGDQRAAYRIPEHLRPKVYDVQIPHSYYSAERLAAVNQERADRGLGPITPENRPDLMPAEERKARADKGTKRASKQSQKKEGGASSTPMDLSGFEGGASSTQVLEVREGGASSTPKLSFNSVLSLSPAPQTAAAPSLPTKAVTDEREKTAPPDDDPVAAAPVANLPAQRHETGTEEQTGAEAVLAAYEQELGGRALNGTRSKLLAQAAELLADRPLWWVVDRARELPQWGDDLIKHASKSKVPFAGQPKSAPACQDVEAEEERVTVPMPAAFAEMLASLRNRSA